MVDYFFTLICTFIYNLLFCFTINKNKKKNVKKEANFWRNSRKYSTFCWSWWLSLAGDDLDKIYEGDDRNAADKDSGDDDDEDEVEDKSSSDNDQPQPQVQLGNQPPRKMLT